MKGERSQVWMACGATEHSNGNRDWPEVEWESTRNRETSEKLEKAGEVKGKRERKNTRLFKKESISPPRRKSCQRVVFRDDILFLFHPLFPHDLYKNKQIPANRKIPKRKNLAPSIIMLAHALQLSRKTWKLRYPSLFLSLCLIIELWRSKRSQDIVFYGWSDAWWFNIQKFCNEPTFSSRISGWWRGNDAGRHWRSRQRGPSDDHFFLLTRPTLVQLIDLKILLEYFLQKPWKKQRKIIRINFFLRFSLENDCLRDV